MSLKKRLLYLTCIISGLLLRVAFPEFCQKDIAWFAIIPLLIILRFSSPREGFYFAFTFGLSFWLSSLAWLFVLRENGGPVVLVIIGFIGLGVWCSLFTGLFGLTTSFLWRGGDAASGSSLWFETWRPLVISLIWVGAEYIRSNLFTGFAWNSLGVSQYEFFPLIQVASIGGVYAVSFVLVLFNASCANVCIRIWRNIRRRNIRGMKPTRRHFDLFVALVILALTLLYGLRETRKIYYYEQVGDHVTIVALNPEMPSVFECTTNEADEVYLRLRQYTKIGAECGADLVVWPETTLFYSLPDSRVEQHLLSFAKDIDTPILAGAVEELITIENDATETQIMNSSFLFGTNDSIEAVYRKQHLVPFGEYIPFDKTFTFLQRFAPAGISCTSGDGPVVMEIAEGKCKISPLICFEDTVADLSRAAVNAGAQVLINQSNDAWFYDSSEAKQHHAQAVFRAVENRVPMVRASNRGVTSAISASGIPLLEDLDRLYISPSIPVANTTGKEGKMGKTIYTQFGDWVFGIPCAVLFVGLLVASAKSKKHVLTIIGEQDNV